MNEASVYLLKQNNGTKEIFSNNFFLSTFESYHPLCENDPYLNKIWFDHFETFIALLAKKRKPVLIVSTTIPM